MERQSIVSFNDDIVIREVPAIDDMSASEIKAVWYEREDYFHFRKREKKLSRRLSSVIEKNFVKIEIGVESDEEKEKRNMRILAVIYTVLLEQERQWDEDDKDVELMAELYRMTSRKSSKLALKRAKVNESEVSSSKRRLPKGSVKYVSANSMFAPCQQRWKDSKRAPSFKSASTPTVSGAGLAIPLRR